MAKATEITLTPTELEDLRDTIKFRENVWLRLKQLNSTPHRVTILETKMAVYAWLIGIVVIGIVGLAMRVLAQ